MIETVSNVSIAAIVCGSALVGLRWAFADRAAAREAKKVAPLGELEARLSKVEAAQQAMAWRK